MTCKYKSFDGSTAHQTVMEILEKLKDYNWDAKALIALAAFALDYGQCLHEVSSSIGDELLTFRFGGMQKFAYFNDLVELALQFVKDIIELESLITDFQSFSGKDISAWNGTPRDIYTYWVILALLASATQR